MMRPDAPNQMMVDYYIELLARGQIDLDRYIETEHAWPLLCSLRHIQHRRSTLEVFAAYDVFMLQFESVFSPQGYDLDGVVQELTHSLVIQAYEPDSLKWLLQHDLFPDRDALTYQIELGGFRARLTLKTAKGVAQTFIIYLDHYYNPSSTEVYAIPQKLSMDGEDLLDDEV